MTYSSVPWSIEQHMIENGDVWIVAYFDPAYGTPIPIAEIVTEDDHGAFMRPEAEANAKLMVAAPRLLDVLQEVLVETNFISLQAARSYIWESLTELDLNTEAP